MVSIVIQSGLGFCFFDHPRIISGNSGGPRPCSLKEGPRVNRGFTEVNVGWAVPTGIMVGTAHPTLFSDTDSLSKPGRV